MFQPRLEEKLQRARELLDRYMEETWGVSHPEGEAGKRLNVILDHLAVDMVDLAFRMDQSELWQNYVSHPDPPDWAVALLKREAEKERARAAAEPPSAPADLPEK